MPAAERRLELTEARTKRENAEKERSGRKGAAEEKAERKRKV